jgi:hypothetical protein
LNWIIVTVKSSSFTFTIITLLTNPSHQNENKNVPFVIITTQLLRFTTYHPMFDRFNMTGASSAAGNAYTPRTPEFNCHAWEKNEMCTGYDGCQMMNIPHLAIQGM